ncbi:MAG TPA: SRPBCC domain-containing protein [Acidimicrobiales bacterium]
MHTTFPVDAPPGAWAALTDPGRLAAALPGCRSVTPEAGAGSGDGALHVVTDVAVASVRGLWAGTVARLDADAVRVRGSGAPGTLDLVVRADPDRTAVTVEGTVEGPLATVGSAVLAAAARRIAHDLLARVAEPPTAPPAVPPAAARRGGRRRGYAAAVAAAAAVATAAAWWRRRGPGRRGGA